MTQLQSVGGVLLVSSIVGMKWDVFSLICSTCIKEVIEVILLKGSGCFVFFNELKHVQTSTCLACEILFGNRLAIMCRYRLL